MERHHILKIVQTVLFSESGRSMVEVLGILAIIGIYRLEELQDIKLH